MTNFHGTDANRAIVAYFAAHSASLPGHIHERIEEAIAEGGLQAIVTAMEALYAARADLSEAGLELLKGLARFVSDNNFHGKRFRAGQIMGVAVRVAEGGEAEVEGDPAIEMSFATPAPAAALDDAEGGEEITLDPVMAVVSEPVEGDAA